MHDCIVCGMPVITAMHQTFELKIHFVLKWEIVWFCQPYCLKLWINQLIG